MGTVEGWETEQLGDQLELIRNGYSGQQVPYVTDFPVSRIETISDGTIDMSRVGYVDFIPDSYLLKTGDLLISNINSLKHIGKVAQVGEGARLFHGMNLLLLRPVEQVDKTFLFYKLINAKPWFEKMAAQAINQASINQVTIKELQLDLPQQKPEQAKIAEILSTVDRAIEQTEALIAKQQRIKTGLMQDLLTRGIDEHGNLRSEQTHEFKDSPLGRIPVEWGVVETKRVCSLITKGTTPKLRSVESPRYSIPYLRVQNLTFSGQINFSEEISFIDCVTHGGELARSKVLPGDVLQNIVGPPLGKIGIVPSDYPEWNINQAIALFRPNKTVSSEFLCHWLQIPATQTWFDINSKKTSGQQNLTLEHCQQVPIVLPSLEEQNRICLLIERSVASQRTGVSELQKLRALKAALMQDLLTGKKRITALLTSVDVNDKRKGVG